MPQNLQEASRRLNQLDAIGTDKSEFTQEAELTIVEQAVGDFIKRVQNNLETEDMTVTGRSADFVIEESATGLNVYANDWLVYQDAGVNGSVNKLYDTPFSYKTKRPPVQAFKDWIETKNIQLRDNAQFADGSDFEGVDVEQAAYAIREDVFKNGIAPTKVYSKEVDQLIEDVSNGIADYAVNIIYNSL